MVTRVQSAFIAGGSKVRTAARRQSFLPLVEFLEARLVFASDFGDAPLPYPTLLAEGGAEHVAVGPTLGSQRDTEPDGVHSVGADNDDSTGVDDEDGVTFGTIRAGALGASATVHVAGGSGKLDAWIDFNHDGSWGGPGEQIANSVSMVSGDNILSFDVPSWAADGTTIARFRLSTSGNLGAGGAAADGEVEDYSLRIKSPNVSCGCFSPPNTLAPDGASSVYAADMDSDGDIDILSASDRDNKIAWYENNGTFTFPTHVITNTADGATSVYAVDLDADGDFDVLSASRDDDRIAWYENDGSGLFTTHTISTSADKPYSVFAFDVDGDGDTDVLSASYLDFKIAWYENDGAENFTAHSITTTATGARSVFATDIDGDGDTDVLSASLVDNKIAWYENDGSEDFSPHTITSSAMSAAGVYAADVDGDGDTDVLSASQDDDTIAWYENNGSQTFTSHAITTAADGARSVFAVDFDRDGDTDVLSASYRDNKVSWYENDGSQNFTARNVTTVAGRAYSAYAVDVDGDGNIDVISASHGDDRITWYKTSSSQFFAAHDIAIGANGVLSVYAADVDRDGDTDILSASREDSRIAWYENNGGESFVLHVITPTAFGASSVYAVDVDGDGDTDVLSAAMDNDEVAWYENDGNQHFTSHIIATGVNLVQNVYAGDVDADGDVDIVSASSSGIDWYENDGIQNFTRYSIIATSYIDVHLADVDNDGDLDFLSASRTKDEIAWFENDGSQHFVRHAISLDTEWAYRVDAVDMDGDGDTDVVSASYYSPNIVWWENDGSQNFLAHTISATGHGTESLYAADLDGDGDTDVLSAWFTGDKVIWYENDGNQDFTAHTITGKAGEFGMRDVYAADVDGDGDLDILSASRINDQIAWYENLNSIVVNTNDSGPGSLRQAIQQANANPGVDTITFAIGAGYQTIAPTSALPAITDTAMIDGTTQPGYAGAPLIEVWGLAAGPNVHGLVIAADDSTVKGIVVNLFSGNGILITGSGNRIENSYIGTDVSGTIAVPNALNGIEIIGGSNNTIGGADPSTANIIAFNDGHGVLIDAGTSNAVRQNSIHSNDGLGIDLINGGNNSQAAPIVTRWTSAGGTTKVWLTLTSTPSTTFSIDVFRNTVCDPSEFGEGEAFLGTAMLTTDAGGTGSIIAVFGVGVPLNQFITAAATSPTDDTSEFSNCRPFRLKAPFTADSVTPLPLPPPPPPPAPGTESGGRQFSGPTFTKVLRPGSPAIDAGANTNAPEWDQRGLGFPRIVNGTIDIGAFEVQATGAPSISRAAHAATLEGLFMILVTADLESLT